MKPWRDLNSLITTKQPSAWSDTSSPDFLNVNGKEKLE